MVTAYERAMGRGNGIFQIAASARLITPHAAGAATLWQAVRQRASIKASPMSKTPLQILQEDTQRVYCESSGSTGPAKLIRRRPESWIASFEINRRRFGITSQDSSAVLGHPGHSLALYAALEAMHLGCGMAFLANHSPRHQIDALRRNGITTLYATPSQLSLLLRTDADRLPRLARIFVGGGRLDTALRGALRTHWPLTRVIEFYGASETSFITISDDQTPEGSVGRAYPGVNLRIGETGAQGETGEIWVQSPYLFDGYAAGCSAMTRWQDGFLSVGESGRLDAAGYLFLAGRLSRMVTVADQNVFPEAIEAVLSARPGVVAAAVITPTDALRGHIIVAAVVGDASAAELRKICRAELGDAAVPRVIWHIPVLPMLPAGKPDLPSLEALWHQGQA